MLCPRGFSNEGILSNQSHLKNLFRCLAARCLLSRKSQVKLVFNLRTARASKYLQYNRGDQIAFFFDMNGCAFLIVLR
jgi:hypothetical protein